MRTGHCAACGLPVNQHFNDRNQMIGCAGAAQALVPVDRGRLLALKLKHNFASRETAIRTIDQYVDERWHVKIGGQVRGKWHDYASRAAAVKAVNDHFNECALAFVERRKPVTE